MPKILTRFSTYTLLVALAISVVAEFYSIVGLTTIFSAAVIPVVIMGVVLGLGKIVATVWLKMNWDRASLTYKLYLIPAIIALMFLTSMGIFGFLSQAHSQQGLVSGDATAKVAVYDERIATSRGNIEANRKALKQMDEAVDQVMARSTTETGADRAVSIRRSQARERARLQAEITTEQATIARLSEERAPLAAEVRKVEAETGPLKYIAAMIYGDNPDANLLESAVRWVIILIVAVFDPLALVLLLAAQQSYRWERQREEEEEEEKEAGVTEFFEKSQLIAGKLDVIDEQIRAANANNAVAEVERPVPEVEIPQPEPDLVAEANRAIAEIEREVPEVVIPEPEPTKFAVEIAPVEWPQYPADDGALTPEQIRQIEYTAQKFREPRPPVESDPTIECHKCGTELVNAPGIGPFCPNKECDVLDGPFSDDEEPVVFTYIPPGTVAINTPDPVVEEAIIPEPVEVSSSSNEVTVDSDVIVSSPVTTFEPEIVTENVTEEKVLYNYSDSHVIFEGKKMSIDNLKSIRPDLILPPDGKIPNKIEFGSEFPKFSLNGDTYIRVDSIPHRVYKFNGRKWMAVDKAANTTYLTNINYLRYLIQKLELNEYDPEFLTLSEQDEIENYLISKKT